MSGTLIPLMAKGIDPTAAYQAYNSMLKTGAEVPETVARTGLLGAQEGEAKARTGLIGAQTTGAGIDNQLKGIGLGIQQQLYAPLAGPGGQPATQGALPWDPAPRTGADLASGRMAAPAPAGAPSPGGPAIGGSQPLHIYATQADTAGTAPAPGPVQSQPLPAPAIGGGIPASQAAAAGPSAGGSPAPAIGGSGAESSAEAPYTSPQGVMYPGLGVPVPRLWALGIAQAQDKNAAISKALQDRRLAIGQMMTGAVGSDGKMNPQAWDQAVRTAFDQGFITNRDAWRYYGHPELGEGLVTSLVPPDQQPMVKRQQAQAQASGTGEGGAPYDIVDVQVKNQDGTFSTMKMSKDMALRRGLLEPGNGAGGGGGQTGAQLANPSTPMSAAEYSNRVRGNENPGGNPAQANTSGPGGAPSSSAVGDGQFVNDTWLGVLKRNRPDLAAGKTDAQLLAMRSDPKLSADMTQALGKENSGALAQAGMPVNATTLGLAHGFGAGGAAKILAAPENTQLTAVFPPTMGANGQPVPNPVIAANPTYARHTVGSIVGNYLNRFGTAPVDFGAAPQAQNIPPGTISQGAPELTGPQKVRVDADRDQIKEDQKSLSDIQTGAMHANSAMPILYSVRDVASHIPTGALGSARADIANFMQTFSPEWANKFMAATTNIDPSKAGAMQEFIKQTFQTVTSAESQLAGARIGARLTEYFSKALPNINMQGDAIKDMTNFLLIGHQMVKDYAQGASAHFNASRDAFIDNPAASRFQPLSKFDQSWLQADSAHAPAVYEAAAMAMNRQPFDTWKRGLSPDQRSEVVDIIRRADPQQGGAFNSKGTWVPVGSFPVRGAVSAPAPAAVAPPPAPAAPAPASPAIGAQAAAVP